jgi:hypothetical protein
MTEPLRILNVSPQFGTGKVPFGGHEETYPLGLARAATAVGVPWTILAPVSSKVVKPGVLPCLDPGDAATLVASLDRHLRGLTAEERITTGVVVYEAETTLAVAFARLAVEHPDVRFLVNLFLSETGVDVPVLRRKKYATQPEVEHYGPVALAERLTHLAGAVWPANLRLTAETDAKALLARSLGLPVTGVWRLHSAMAEREAAVRPVPADGPGVRDGDPMRVLIALRSSHIHPPLIRDVVDVIERVARAGGGDAITWRTTGRFYDHPRVTAALRHLRRVGVRVDGDERPLDPDAYAQSFLDTDVVWMPAVWPYRVQSSGKALDAIVLGRPVVAPAGTAAAEEMRRWVPGVPTYGSPSEAAQLFLRLPSLHGLLRAELARQATTIRETHHPRTTVAWVRDQLLGMRDEVEAPLLGAVPMPLGASGSEAQHRPRGGRVRGAGKAPWPLSALPGAFRAFAQAIREHR